MKFLKEKLIQSGLSFFYYFLMYLLLFIVILFLFCFYFFVLFLCLFQSDRYLFSDGFQCTSPVQFQFVKPRNCNAKWFAFETSLKLQNFTFKKKIFKKNFNVKK